MATAVSVDLGYVSTVTGLVLSGAIFSGAGALDIDTV